MIVHLGQNALTSESEFVVECNCSALLKVEVWLCCLAYCLTTETFHCNIIVKRNCNIKSDWFRLHAFNQFENKWFSCIIPAAQWYFFCKQMKQFLCSNFFFVTHATKILHSFKRVTTFSFFGNGIPFENCTKR